MSYDVVIRGGTVVDGLGGEPVVGDVGVANGVIVALGVVEGTGVREIDATGMIVTPGFVDLHTHYDGQAIWSDRCSPSSSHGVTTALMGNCGVGFAPCRTEDHDVLVDVMAGVEDIPGVVMTDGLPWDWETFPEYLDALESRQHDIDVAAYLPHSPLRVYVMGQRGADREPATPEDLALMRKLAAEAVEVGALGVSSSRFAFHKTGSGAPIPTYGAAYEEISAIAAGVADGGGGLLQFIPDIAAGGYEGVLQEVFEAATDAGLPVTFTLTTGNSGAPIWPEAVELVEKFNSRPDRKGDDITAQVFARPIGLVIGLELTANPFVLYPSYREIAHLPLPERVAEMGKPEVRERILADKPGAGHPFMYFAQSWQWMFPLTDPANYEPSPEESILARARARGVSPLEEAYDRLLDDDGHAMMLVALAIGNGGAHYGMICDASYPTSALAHWARDRAAELRRGGADDDIGARAGGRPGRPRAHRGRIQGRSQCDRPRAADLAPAGHHL